MTKRLVRKSEFSLTLEIGETDFLNTPRSDQRNWILKRVLKEASDDLEYANARAPAMIRGEEPTSELKTLREENLSAESIMESWQIPVMERMAQLVCSQGDSVLEIGYGRGIASEFVQAQKPASHEIIECNPLLCVECEKWIGKQGNGSINLVPGKWQDVLSELGTYDGILFHTYPVDEEDYAENVRKSSTFAEHFFATAKDLLNPGGRLTYFTLESDSLGRNHQRALFEHFSSVKLSKMDDLQIPDNTRDALWLPSLVMVEVQK